MREPEDAAAVGCDLDRHAFAHAAETVEQMMADELEIPGDRPAVAADRTFRGARAPRHGLLCRRFFRGCFLRRLLALRSLLRDLLACDFHSTLHAVTSREALARLSAAGEMPCRRSTVSGAVDCRPTAAGCKLAPILRTDARACDIMRRGDGSAAGIVMRTVAIVIAMLVATATAHSAEINAFVSTAIKAATDELLPPFERAHGHTIRASYAPSGALIPRFERGEPVDVFLTDSAAIDGVSRRGKGVAGRTDLARTGIGIAVRKGAPRPDVSSPEALKRALLAARSVGHAAPAAGSITAAHVERVFQRLGIAAEVAPKVKLAAGGPNGRVSVLVSSGEAEIGLQQVSELMSNPQVEVIGMLPAELQLITLYSAGVTTSAREGEAARALIKALTAPSAAAIYKAKGLDPAW